MESIDREAIRARAVQYIEFGSCANDVSEASAEVIELSQAILTLLGSEPAPPIERPTEPITVKTSDGWHIVDAQIYGAFAVHLTLGSDDGDDVPWYAVTHKRTGVGIWFGPWQHLAIAVACLMNMALVAGNFDAQSGDAFDAFKVRASHILGSMRRVQDDLAKHVIP